HPAVEPEGRDHGADGARPGMGGAVRGADPGDDGVPVIFTPTPLPGALLIEPESHEDHRGSFTRTFCVEEFAAHGLETRLVQCSLSHNHRRGTLRGMHFQAAPREEVKVVRCVRGAIHDVIVDLRPDSPTYTKHFAGVLSAATRRASRTGSRRWRTTPRCCTRCPSSIRRSTRAACGGTTRRSASTGRSRTRSSSIGTPRTLTTCPRDERRGSRGRPRDVRADRGA